MQYNFCASFLTFQKKKILDESGNDIPTIEYTWEVYPLKYRKPSIIYDFLEDSEREKEQSIIELSYKKLTDMGYSIYAFYAPKTWGWKSSSKYLTILKSGSPEEKYGTLKKSTDGHKILMDEANLRIKLIGPKSGPHGTGEWIKL